jgi:hypothetical protein
MNRRKFVTDETRNHVAYEPCFILEPASFGHKITPLYLVTAIKSTLLKPAFYDSF